MDDVPLIRAIGNSSASPFVAVPSGWHHLETSVRGDDRSIELAFGTLLAGHSYDLVRRGDPNTAIALVEEPANGGSMRVLDLRGPGAAPVRLRGLGATFTLAPGSVVARAPIAGTDTVVSVSDVSGFELANASLAAHGSDHQDLTLIIDGDHGTEIVAFSARSPIVMTPLGSIEPTSSTDGGSSVSVWALAAVAFSAITVGGFVGRQRGRRRRKLAAIARQHAFRQSIRA